MKKKDLLFPGLLFLTLLIFFGDLFILKSGFLCGDHREQQYPWAYFLQSQIRQFQLPWWTSSIHAGFPLLAEGQIGALYPVNWLFLFLLPIKAAYNYGILFHYLLGAAFFYAYLRMIGRSRWGTFFATLIFLYGSTQGGYFYYNYISQKVVIWLPLSLILIERIIKSPSFRDAFWLALVFTLELFAGYLQVAVYTILFSILYFLYRWFSNRCVKSLALFSIAGLLGIFFSLVQLLPTYELALFSSRADAVKDVAFIGSMNPLGLLTLFYPSWDGFLGSELYVGLFGLGFAFWSLKHPRNSHRNFFVFSTITFLLLALGKWSPLYRGIIELTHFYSFRTPIKFLFFVSFSVAVLATFGFDAFFQPSNGSTTIRPSKYKNKLIVLLFVSMLVVPTAGELVLVRGESLLKSKILTYVEKNIFGKAGHPHDLEFYKLKTEDFYQGLKSTVTLKNPSTRTEFLLLVLALLLMVMFMHQSSSTKKKLFACLFLLLDLYLYSFTSIQANKEPLNSIPPPIPDSNITRVLAHEPRPFRIIENMNASSSSVRYPILPSTNMLYSLDDLGAYSPLIMKKYKAELAGWGGYFNDSFQTEWMSSEMLLSRLDDLRRLNVKFILSHEEISNPNLKLRAQDHKFKLYELSEPFFPRAFFSSDSSAGTSLRSLQHSHIQPVDIKQFANGAIDLEVTNAISGNLFVSEIFYPGWKAWDGHQQIEIQKWGNDLFQAVPLSPGSHQIRMRYQPTHYISLGIAAILVAFILFVITLKTNPMRPRA